MSGKKKIKKKNQYLWQKKMSFVIIKKSKGKIVNIIKKNVKEKKLCFS